MAFINTAFNPSTANTDDSLMHIATDALTEGVADLEAGDFLVSQNGTPNKSVNVAAGVAYVPNETFVKNTGVLKFWRAQSSATVNVAIADNASGNPRIDIICVKIDDAAATSVRGAGSVSVVVVAGTPGASPAVPATPADHYKLAEVAVANGFTSITNANITDLRKGVGIRKIISSWETLNYTFVYTSADDPTYTMTVASTDVTGYIWVGMKIRIKQAGAYLYFIVTKIAFSTNTVVTLYGGSDYDLANVTIQEVGVSIEKSPIGFPMDPTKWTQVSVIATLTQNSPTSTTYYSPGNLSIPIGKFTVKLQTVVRAVKTGGSYLNITAGLSTANNSLSTTNWAIVVPTTGVDNAFATPNVTNELSLTTKTTYYFVVMTQSDGTLSALYAYGASNNTLQEIRAVCAYL